MGKIFDKVSPGDLITAELMNKVLETVEGLDDRISAMETATKGSISGTVKDMENGLPIVGATVRAILGNASYNSTPSDNQGLYTIADLSPGDYTLIAAAENYLDSPALTVSVAAGVPRVANFMLNRSAGLVVVPKLFGLTLSQARTVVGLPSVNLEIGTVITSHGLVYSADDAAAQSRVVLNQVPDENTAVPTDTRIDLVVSAAVENGGGNGGTEGVVITGFIPTAAEGRAIGEDLTITGKNFEIPVQNNTVTIGGVQVEPPEGATSPFLAGSGSETLIFRIPDIPGIIDSPQDVEIVVVNKNGEARFDGYPVSPATTEPKPQITELVGFGPNVDDVDRPNAVRIGAHFRITGSNFAPNPQENEIRFTSGGLVVDIPAASINISNSSDTEIFVDAFPTFLPLPTKRRPTNFILSVRVGGILADYGPQIRAYPAV